MATPKADRMESIDTETRSAPDVGMVDADADGLDDIDDDVEFDDVVLLLVELELTIKEEFEGEVDGAALFSFAALKALIQSCPLAV